MTKWYTLMWKPLIFTIMSIKCFKNENWPGDTQCKKLIQYLNLAVILLFMRFTRAIQCCSEFIRLLYAYCVILLKGNHRGTHSNQTVLMSSFFKSVCVSSEPSVAHIRTTYRPFFQSKKLFQQIVLWLKYEIILVLDRYGIFNHYTTNTTN